MTKSMSQVIEELAGDRNLVFDFFALFSRFEYALKRAGFLRDKERAEPNWDAYTNSLRGSFATDEDDRFNEALKLHTRQPPKTQVAVMSKGRRVRATRHA